MRAKTTQAVVLASLLAGCDFTWNQNQSNSGDGSPTVPGSIPSPSSCALVDRVRIGTGGATCSIGSGNALTLNCAWDITATPLTAGDQPADPSVHGPDVTWTATANIRLEDRGDNRFNKRLVVASNAPRDWQVTATNCGKTGELRGTVQ